MAELQVGASLGLCWQGLVVVQLVQELVTIIILPLINRYKSLLTNKYICNECEEANK